MRVLITGASSGIGKALAQHYLHQGDEVIGCGRNQVALEQLARQHPQFSYLLFDGTDVEQVQRQFDTVTAALDLVVLNAGDCEYIDIDQFDAAIFARMMAVNVVATMNVMAHCLPRLNRGSQLAVVSSAATRFHFARAQAYAGSKAALDQITLTMQAELYPRGIAVSLIQPGFVTTPLTSNNDFPMPFCISAEQAAQRITLGLAKRKALIAFPKRLLLALKILSWLPQQTAHRLLQRPPTTQPKLDASDSDSPQTLQPQRGHKS